MKRLLIANRGEVAARIARTAADLGIGTVGVHAGNDTGAGHLTWVDESVDLDADGVAAYLDARRLLDAASHSNCDAVHPGWGFLAENSDFAAACENAGLTFVGPTPRQLADYADKLTARKLAESAGVSVLPGTGPLPDAQALADFLETLPEGQAVMLKAAAGGGGRGITAINAGDDPVAAFERCSREAQASFGDGTLYAERALLGARHVEVQTAADTHGTVVVLGDRDCSLQRRRQKLVEVAPVPGLSDAVRQRLHDAARAVVESGGLRGLATVEFLLTDDALCFIEVNPRLQVEHTITETLLGIDLVAVQIGIARGESLEALGVAPPPGALPGHAVQVRINAERLRPDGLPLPSAGTLASLDFPGGPGVRVDTAVRAGDAVTGEFDPLLAKLVVHSAAPALETAIDRAARSAAATRVQGVETSASLAAALLEHPAVRAGRWHTTLVDEVMSELLVARAPSEPDTMDRPRSPEDAPNERSVVLPLRGTLVSIDAAAGDPVPAGARIATVESMKMHHDVIAPVAGTVLRLLAGVGDTLDEGAAVLVLTDVGESGEAAEVAATLDVDAPRGDLDDLEHRLALTRDEHRATAVAKRHSRGFRTARENVADLVDAGSFIEYGALTVAAQRRRRSLDDLMASTPADGMIAGVGTVNASEFDGADARCAVLAYDYTVLAGTQGHVNHKKKDRLFELAAEWAIPTVFFTEGGGGRPGDVDTDDLIMSWLDLTTFTTWAELSGIAPRIAVNSGRCFAGNAVVFGCADVTIATRNSNIGLAGPAMIEGGGLGRYAPEDIGPIDVQTANGVVDLVCDDEADATGAARRVLGYFQGTTAAWQATDQRRLRHHVPEDRLRVYDVRAIIEDLADVGSVTELRRDYGVGLITAFIRVEGRPFGLIANDPRHLGGAIDSEGGEKGARFVQLCDTFGLPIVSLCDSPGYMVGPDSERTAAVRRGSRLIVATANLTVPLFTVVVRKCYGLGGQAMAGGGLHRPFFTIAWPTAEFGPMGLEGAVELGFRKELEAATDDAARKALFDELVGHLYAKGKGVSVAQTFEMDAVIDPADTRAWLMRGLASAGPVKRATRRYVDVW